VPGKTKNKYTLGILLKGNSLITRGRKMCPSGGRKKNEITKLIPVGVVCKVWESVQDFLLCRYFKGAHLHETATGTKTEVIGTKREGKSWEVWL